MSENNELEQQKQGNERPLADGLALDSALQQAQAIFDNAPGTGSGSVAAAGFASDQLAAMSEEEASGGPTEDQTSSDVDTDAVPHHYSRGDRLRQSYQQDEDERPSTPWGISLLMSCLIVASSFLLLAFGFTMTFAQEHNLYAGWAQTQGADAYRYFFGTDGFLFYLTSWLGSILGGKAYLFALAQIPFLLFSGRNLYRLAYQVTGRNQEARQLVPLFYLLLAFLAFGGFYSTLFVLPILLWAADFQLENLQEQKSGRRFLVYGMLAATAFLLAPTSTVLFYLSSTLVLALYNMAHKRTARGTYELFAALTGFSLAFFPLGYWTVVNGTFGYAVDQVLYPITSLALNHANLLENALTFGLLTLALGFATALVQSFLAKPKEGAAVLAWTARLAIVLGLPLLILSDQSGTDKILILLPYLFFLLIVGVGKGPEASNAEEGASEETPSLLSRYLKANLFAPVLALFFVIAYPVTNQYLISRSAQTARNQAASYVKKNSKQTDTIYLWDTDASLYRKTKRLAGSSILLPTEYTGTGKNRVKVERDLVFARPRYILVNGSVAKNAEVDRMIKESYKEVQLDKMGAFKLYEEK